MKPSIKVINKPRPHVISMIKRRMPADIQRELDTMSFDAIALIDTNVPGIFYYGDVAEKASDVFSAELYGTCPQHISTLALFGDTSAVGLAVKAIIQNSEN